MVTPKQLRKLFAAGYQLTPEAYSLIENVTNIESVIEKILSKKFDKAILSVEDLNKILNQEKAKQPTISDLAIEDEKDEEFKAENLSVYTALKSTEYENDTSKSHLRKEKISADLEIISSPKNTKSPASAKSFLKYFESRFDEISQMFIRRRDIQNIIKTSSFKPSSSKDSISVIALIINKQKTRKGHIILDLEDKEGRIKGLITQSNVDLIHKAEFILEDSVLCFTGTYYNGMLSIKDIQWPDIPYGHRPNHAYEEVLALFLSDIHVGSRNFAGNLFLRVINFLNGKLESEKYNQVGQKVKYLFVAGDVVDGVGVYPGQIEDLVLDDLHLQYLLSAEYFEQIRSDIEIIVIPGNHDGARAAEPQTPIQKEFAPELYTLDNVRLLGSPSYLKAHNVEILMSHGNSIMDINSAIPAIPHETSMPAMVEMLKNRHLVPIYGKRTPIVPDSVDQLVIKKIPDIFQTGHTHLAGDETYKGVTLINSGTFQFQTSYQKSMNINPTTGQTYVINLKNLQRTVVDFNQIF
ncbi:MAG: metallophosphoesterase [Candidatus Heimdallarchaeota archaeon]|nr:metallophosphoesterase [Candidatus Heimdallarchaeota archaeon]MCK4955389.1 metallophosphoesterase [Candidatus Heimdallarchaeota archaeon]